MKKKLLSILLATVILAGSLAGCASKDNGNTNSSDTGKDTQTTSKTDDGSDYPANMSQPGEFPIAKEKINLKVFFSPNPFIIDMNTNDTTKWMEDKTNVHIEWMLGGADAGEKINLMLATNDKKEMPDVFMGGIGRPAAEDYGSKGVFLDLSEYLDKYSVNYKEDLFVHSPNLRGATTAFDGKIYFLTPYYETIHMQDPQKMWMNQRWLKNVKMEVPTTTDEFYNVLKAFKEQDANGNGDKNDEIPFVCLKDGLNFASVESFTMNPFTYTSNGSGGFYVEDGTIKVPYTQDGWKEGLRFHKKLYEEGLLDSEAFTLTSEQAMAISADAKGSRLGCAIGISQQAFISMDSPELTDYVTIAPLKGPTGLQQSPRNPFSPYPHILITSYCENPEIAFRWADCMAIDIAGELKKGNYEWMPLWYGPEEGKAFGWEKAKEGDKGFTGEKAYYKSLFNWGDKLNNHWYESFNINMKADWKAMNAVVDDGKYNLEKDLYDSTMTKYKPYEVDKNMPSVSLNPEDALESAALTNDLTIYYKECTAKFVRGEMDIDKDWDTYIKEIDNIGLPRLIEINQAAYDRTYKK